MSSIVYNWFENMLGGGNTHVPLNILSKINPFHLHLGMKQAGIICFILKLVKLKPKQNMLRKQIHTLLHQQNVFCG